SYEKNLQAFQEEALKLPVGSNRQPNTRIYLARKTFDKVADAFSKKVELPEDTQIHHALEDGGLAEDPLGALDASHLEIVKGKTAVLGTSHNRADRAVKYQKQGVKNPGLKATEEMEKAQAQGAQAASQASQPAPSDPAPAPDSKASTSAAPPTPEP